MNRRRIKQTIPADDLRLAGGGGDDHGGGGGGGLHVRGHLAAAYTRIIHIRRQIYDQL